MNPQSIFNSGFEIPAIRMLPYWRIRFLAPADEIDALFDEIIKGARRLPASETALISALETPLAPLWACLLFSEFPSPAAWIGGAIILLAVFGSQLLAMRRRNQGV